MQVINVNILLLFLSPNPNPLTLKHAHSSHLTYQVNSWSVLEDRMCEVKRQLRKKIMLEIVKY